MSIRNPLMVCMLACVDLFSSGVVENLQDLGKGLSWPKAEKVSQVQEFPGTSAIAERGMEFKIPAGWKKVAPDTEVKGHDLKSRTGFLSFEVPDIGMITIWLGPKFSSDLVWKDLETRVCELVPNGSVVKRTELKIKLKGEYPIILTYKGSIVKKGIKQDAYIIYGFKEPGMFSPTLGKYKIFVRILNPENISKLERDIHFIVSTFIHRPANDIDAANIEFIKEVIKESSNK